MALTIGIAVVLIRFIAPLFILRWPLPAILVCLVVDAADQSIFAALTDDPLLWYQAYDKALDVFYLSIAYIATIQTWQDHRAFQLGRFLYYWRLIGSTLFQLTGLRFLLLLFPNAFEYVFIAYEAIRTRWSPWRLTSLALVTIAGAITVFIKIPQETWIHILQLDFTDAMRNHPQLIPLVVAFLIAVVVVGVLMLRRAPDPDWPFTTNVTRHLEPRPVHDRLNDRWWDSALLEKVIFLALIGISLSHALPELETSTWHIVLTVALLVVINTAVTEWWARRRGHSWTSTAGEFVAVLFANLLIIGLLPDFLLRNGLPDQDPLFFVVLISLLSTLFDRAIATRHRPDEPVHVWAEARVELAEWRRARAATT